MDAARKKLRVAAQGIDHLPIADALLRARGVRLMDVVLEAAYLREPRPLSPDASGRHSVNRRFANDTMRAAIDVKADFNPAIFHQKFIVRDGAAVLPGSTNFTTTGVTRNLNHIVVMEERQTA